MTADGEVRRVDAAHEPELSWALRGGGGGQAIVTEIELDLFPLATAFAGSMLWPMTQAERIVDGYREWVAGVPEALTSTLKLTRFPDLQHIPAPLRGRRLVEITLAYCGTEAAGRALVRPLLQLADPHITRLGIMPDAADHGFLPFNEHDRRLDASFPAAVAERLGRVTQTYDRDGVLLANHRGR